MATRKAKKGKRNSKGLRKAKKLEPKKARSHRLE
jgi:hypothetical protein